MPPNQLIIAPPLDINAAAASWGLRISGFNPVWPQTGSLADDCLGAISLSSDSSSEWRAAGGIEPGRFSAIWYRRPRVREQFARAAASDQAFVRDEWRSLQDNIYALGDAGIDALWVNPPDAARLTENKLVQLRVAAACGIEFPRTLVSNDADKIIDFVRSNDRTIYKPFRPHSWVNQSTGAVYDTPAAVLKRDERLQPAALSLCPGIYQTYIEKRSDIRVTVIGDRMYAARIKSRSQGAFTDWRPAAKNNTDLCVEPCQLPTAYAEKLRELMKRLGVVYGAIDLAERADGELVFLEVNQVGQFLFVESWLPEFPLLRAFCAMLGEGRTDYSLSSCPEVSWNDFGSSEDCQSQAEKVAVAEAEWDGLLGSPEQTSHAA